MPRRIKDHDVSIVFWFTTSLALILTFPILLKQVTIFSGGEKYFFGCLLSLLISIFIGLLFEAFGSLIVMNKKGKLRLKHILAIFGVLGGSILLGILINRLSEVLSPKVITYIHLIFWTVVTILLLARPRKN